MVIPAVVDVEWCQIGLPVFFHHHWREHLIVHFLCQPCRCTCIISILNLVIVIFCQNRNSQELSESDVAIVDVIDHYSRSYSKIISSIWGDFSMVPVTDEVKNSWGTDLITTPLTNAIHTDSLSPNTYSSLSDTHTHIHVPARAQIPPPHPLSLNTWLELVTAWIKIKSQDNDKDKCIVDDKWWCHW